MKQYTDEEYIEMGKLFNELVNNKYNEFSKYYYGLDNGYIPVHAIEQNTYKISQGKHNIIFSFDLLDGLRKANNKQ